MGLFLGLVLAALLLSACSLNPRPWTRMEKVSAAASLACFAADAATTLYAREVVGLEEANPIVEHYGIALGLNVALVAAAYVAGELLDNRTGPWLGAATSKCAVAAWNVGVIAAE